MRWVNRALKPRVDGRLPASHFRHPAGGAAPAEGAVYRPKRTLASLRCVGRAVGIGAAAMTIIGRARLGDTGTGARGQCRTGRRGWSRARAGTSFARSAAGASGRAARGGRSRCRPCDQPRRLHRQQCRRGAVTSPYSTTSAPTGRQEPLGRAQPRPGPRLGERGASRRQARCAHVERRVAEFQSRIQTPPD